MQPPRAELDEKEDIQPLQQERVDAEEVAGEELRPMLREEGAPGGVPAPGRGRQIMPTQDALDRGLGDAVAHLEELALNLAITPGAILAGEAHDQVDGGGRERR